MKRIVYLLALLPSFGWTSGIYNPGSGSGSSLPFPAGATNYIQVSSTLQSGATFYVSSGTVTGQLKVGSLYDLGLSQNQIAYVDTTGKFTNSSNILIDSVGTIGPGGTATSHYGESINPASSVEYGMSVVIDDGFANVTSTQVAGIFVAQGGPGAGYALYADANNNGNNFALYANNGHVNIQELSASQFVQTNGTKNLVSYDLLNATQTWTGYNTWTSTSAFTKLVIIGTNTVHVTTGTLEITSRVTDTNILQLSTSSTANPLLSVSTIPAINPTDYLLNVSSANGTQFFGVQNNGYVIAMQHVLIGTSTVYVTTGTVSIIPNPVDVYAFQISTSVTANPLISVSSIPAIAPTDYLINVSSTNATQIFGVQYNSHIVSSGTVIPVLSSCGTSPSINGSDVAGTVTAGATSGGCTVTFGVPYPLAPHCVVTPQTGSVANTFSYTVSATAITVTETALGTGKFDYICIVGQGS